MQTPLYNSATTASRSVNQHLTYLGGHVARKLSTEKSRSPDHPRLETQAWWTRKHMANSDNWGRSPTTQLWTADGLLAHGL